MKIFNIAALCFSFLISFDLQALRDNDQDACMGIKVLTHDVEVKIEPPKVHYDDRVKTLIAERVALQDQKINIANQSPQVKHNLVVHQHNLMPRIWVEQDIKPQYAPKDGILVESFEYSIKPDSTIDRSKNLSTQYTLPQFFAILPMKTARLEELKKAIQEHKGKLTYPDLVRLYAEFEHRIKHDIDGNLAVVQHALQNPRDSQLTQSQCREIKRYLEDERQLYTDFIKSVEKQVHNWEKNLYSELDPKDLNELHELEKAFKDQLLEVQENIKNEPHLKYLVQHEQALQKAVQYVQAIQYLRACGNANIPERLEVLKGAWPKRTELSADALGMLNKGGRPLSFLEPRQGSTKLQIQTSNDLKKLANRAIKTINNVLDRDKRVILTGQIGTLIDKAAESNAHGMVAKSWALMDIAGALLGFAEYCSEELYSNGAIVAKGVYKAVDNTIRSVTHPHEVANNLMILLVRYGEILAATDSDSLMPTDYTVRTLEDLSRSYVKTVQDTAQQIKTLNSSEMKELAAQIIAESLLEEGLLRTIKVVGTFTADRLAAKLKNAGVKKLSDFEKRILDSVGALNHSIENAAAGAAPAQHKGKAKNVGKKVVEGGWSMPEHGLTINGRYYTQHALERMAPETIEVIKELEKRALAKGYARGTDDFVKYVKPRNIPPMVVEDCIQNSKPSIGRNPGTLIYKNYSVQVITNTQGHVVSVYRI